MLNEAVFPFSSFYHLLSPFLFPKFLPHFLFFFVLFSLVYSTWAQVSLGHCNLRNGAGTLLLLYISFTTTPVITKPPSCHAPLHFPPFPGLFFLLPLPSHMYFYQLPLVSSTCHFHRAVCLYPTMCIPYSISPCSLTLYGALAGHCRRQSSFIRCRYVII